MLHKLLQKQLSKAGFSALDIPRDYYSWLGLLHEIALTYKNFEREHRIKGIAVERYSKEMQEKLEHVQSLESSFRSVVECVPNTIIRLNRDGKIDFCNKKRNEFTIEGLVGKNFYSFFGHDEATRLKEAIEIVFQTGRVQELETQVSQDSSSQNTSLWYSHRIGPISFKDKIQQVVIVETDITERKIMQELVDNERANALNSAKMATLGEMAGGIAHEINNPLAVIQLRADALVNSGKQNLLKTEYVIATAEKIQVTVGRISKIISGLKAFARSDGHEPFVTTIVSSILADSFDLCQEKLKFEGIKLIASEVGGDFSIECRGTQIVQVLVNLLNNSTDALKGKTEKWIKCNLVDRGDSIEISMTDSGPGIPLHLRSKIMQPFFTTKEVGRGTGLGLSISKGIVESHGGKLYVDHLCSNTKFVVLLPKKMDKTVLQASIEAA